MNQLSIEKRRYTYLDNNKAERTCEQFEFVIDGCNLSETLGFESRRPWFGANRRDCPSNPVRLK